MKLKWRVAPAPTGRYRSFESRGWPDGMYRDKDENAAVNIVCEDEYSPQDALDGKHRPLTVYVARWVKPEARGTGSAFTWCKVVTQCSTLDEAKAVAQSILNDRPHFWPEGVT